MRTNKKLNIVIALFTMIAFGHINKASAQPGTEVSFQLFYDELAPYGEWVNDPEYGYMWIPDEGSNFRPYGSNGNWVMTSYGNTWVSNYSWGWAPFHYGRWNYSDYYGWAWIPGYEWGPAWVSWRNGGGYYGWAPLLPGLNISVNVNIPSFAWLFVPQRYICSSSIYRYYAPHRDAIRIYNSTRYINNTYIYNNHTYVSGPSRRDLEHVTRSRVSVRDIRDASRPGRNSVNSNSVSMYRPEVGRGGSANDARPSRVSDVNTVVNNRSSRSSSHPSSNSNVRNSTTYSSGSFRTGRSGNQINNGSSGSVRNTASRTNQGTSTQGERISRPVSQGRSNATTQQVSKQAERTESARPSARTETSKASERVSTPARRASSSNGRSSRGR